MATNTIQEVEHLQLFPTQTLKTGNSKEEGELEVIGGSEVCGKLGHTRLKEKS